MMKLLHPSAWFLAGGLAAITLAGCSQESTAHSSSGIPSSAAELNTMSLDELKRLDTNPKLAPIQKMVIESKIHEREAKASTTPAPRR